MTGRFSLPRRRLLATTVIALCGAAFASMIASANWPHYRGPTLDGVAAGKLPTKLPAAGPRELWRASVGTGTSAVTVSGGRAFSMGNVDGNDVVYCLDAKTGKEVWRHSYPQLLDKRMFEGGPAATPTIDGARVFTLSHQGDLFCLDAASGKKIWHVHFQNDFGGRRPEWGFAGSPTVEGNLLICDVGGAGASTVALDKTTGKVVWKSGDYEAGYASPVVATIAGKRTAVIFKGKHLVGLDAKDGRELWRSAWKTDYDVNAATPLVLGDRVFITSGYGAGCALIGITGGGARELWRNKNLRAHVNTPVAWQGCIFGIDGQTGPRSPLVCLDSATGAVKWTEKSVGGGGLVLADGRLVIVTERGELVIGDASPSGFTAISRSQVLRGRCWVQPSVSDGKIFAKNNQGDLVCLELK